MKQYVDCECGHEYIRHSDTSVHCCLVSVEGKPLCGCKLYDPAGHNPEQKNFICRQCKLTRMERNIEGRYFFCFACGYVIFDKQVKELLGES